MHWYILPELNRSQAASVAAYIYYSNRHISGAIMIAVLQDRGHVITSHGYSSGSRSSSAAPVLQSDAAIRVMMALVEFSWPHNSHKVSCHLGTWSTAVVHLMLIQRCVADGGLATALYDHASCIMQSSLSTFDLRVCPHLAF